MKKPQEGRRSRSSARLVPRSPPAASAAPVSNATVYPGWYAGRATHIHGSAAGGYTAKLTIGVSI